MVILTTRTNSFLYLSCTSRQPMDSMMLLLSFSEIDSILTQEITIYGLPVLFIMSMIVFEIGYSPHQFECCGCELAVSSPSPSSFPSSITSSSLQFTQQQHGPNPIYSNCYVIMEEKSMRRHRIWRHPSVC